MPDTNPVPRPASELPQVRIKCREDLEKIRLYPTKYAKIPGFGGEQTVHYLTIETNFVPVAGVEASTLTSLDQKLIGQGLKACPLCLGEGVVSAEFVGETTGLSVLWYEPCACKKAEVFAAQWYSMVPALYEDCSWDGLLLDKEVQARFLRGPNPIRPETFKRFIHTVLAYPNASILMVGPAGSGKSSFMWALCRADVGRWTEKAVASRKYTPAVWAITAREMADSNQAFAMSDDKAKADPLISRKRVDAAIAAGFIPSIYIDEFEKRKMGEFQNQEFHSVIDKVYSHGGRVVAVSNKSRRELEDVLGPAYGPTTLRRIVGDPCGIILDFFKQEIIFCDALKVVEDQRIADAGGQVATRAAIPSTPAPEAQSSVSPSTPGTRLSAKSWEPATARRR